MIDICCSCCVVPTPSDAYCRHSGMQQSAQRADDGLTDANAFSFFLILLHYLDAMPRAHRAHGQRRISHAASAAPMLLRWPHRAESTAEKHTAPSKSPMIAERDAIVKRL